MKSFKLAGFKFIKKNNSNTIFFPENKLYFMFGPKSSKIYEILYLYYDGKSAIRTSYRLIIRCQYGEFSIPYIFKYCILSNNLSYLKKVKLLA